jgi:chemotaxis protein methyltransferase WspC
MDLYAPVETMLADRVGFAAELIGRPTLERALAAVAARAGIPVGNGLIERLQRAGDEWRHLLDELIVSETWFFRDREPYIFLASHLRRRAVTAPARILSVPCSTGEEPYSIAITLREAGLAPGQFVIHAADLSQAAIDRARGGEYGPSSFREPTSLVMETYFRATGAGWRVRESLASLVEFHQANLLAPVSLAAFGPFDVIFCRNVLIYMHEEARRLVLSSIGAMLAPDGVVVTGHSEVVIFLQAGFERVDHARAFACRKRSAGDARPLSGMRARRPQPPSDAAPDPAPPAPPSPSVASARRLADQGDLEAAAAQCEALIGEGAADAEIYYLLGLVSQASDHLVRAEKLFQQALYLDPAHYESLVAMSLLAEHQGDSTRREVFRARAARAARGAEEESQ